jgi:hypothetical protein
MYVVDRDFGFAPNPFHGFCTLATCMARIRAKAQGDDWIVGMGGRRLKATGRCVYAMRVTDTREFGQYWAEKEYFDKRPVRNGSRVMMVGDNIYRRETPNGEWIQLDSHHSNPDGTPNQLNIGKDTKADRVLISRDFYYFGRSAPHVPPEILKALGFKNKIGYRKFNSAGRDSFLSWLLQEHARDRNVVVADPFDFEQTEKRYSGRGSKIL